MRSRRPRKTVRIRGLTRKQHAFLREKVFGLNDKEAALAAGYSLSVAENTKQKIWAQPEIRSQFERLIESLRLKGMNQNSIAEGPVTP
jgi:phage terminase small subunit